MKLLGRVVQSAFHYTRDLGLWEETRLAIARDIEHALATH